jgi:uncharacterized membrane protein
MNRAYLIYSAYMLFSLLLVGLVLAVPFLAFNNDMTAAYEAFGYTCHQKLSRSICLFTDGSGYWIGDCTQQNGSFVSSYADRAALGVDTGSAVGYKMPVCARDFGIYGAMLLAGFLYPFMRRLDERGMWPALYLILALVPIALDGGVQLLSDIGWLPFAYESTNFLRLLTGAIAGGAASFYAIPLLVNLFGGDEDAGSGLKSAELKASVPKPAGRERAPTKKKVEKP